MFALVQAVSIESRKHEKVKTCANICGVITTIANEPYPGIGLHSLIFFSSSLSRYLGLKMRYRD